MLGRQVVEENSSSCSIPREQLRALFQIFDVEHSGKIDARELKAALRALGVAASASQVKEVLGAIGRDVITFEDFCAIAEAQLPQRNSLEAFRQTFELFGGEEAGYLTVRHLRRVCEELNEDIPDADLEAMIAEADRDGDGCVTFDDFARIMRQKYEPFQTDSD